MRAAWKAVGPVLLVLIWSLFCALAGASVVVLPPPGKVFLELVAMAQTSEFWRDCISTALRLLAGFALATVAGVPVGFVLGYFDRIHEMSELVIEFLRAIPAIAFFPVFLVIFKLGEEPKIGIAAVMGGLVILFSTIESVRKADQRRMLVSRVLGATSRQLITKVLVWEALPGVMTGLRVGLSLSLIAVLVTEMFSGTEFGLGWRIMESSDRVRTPKMYALVCVVGLVGLCLNKALASATRKAVHWVGKE